MPRIPAVEIEIGGEVRRLIYDFNALAELEDQVATFASDAARLKLARASLWAGLLSETLDDRGRPTKRTLSLQQVGDLVSFENLEYLQEKIAEAMSLAQTVLRPEAEAAAAAVPFAAPTGTSS